VFDFAIRHSGSVIKEQRGRFALKRTYKVWSDHRGTVQIAVAAGADLRFQWVSQSGSTSPDGCQCLVLMFPLIKVRGASTEVRNCPMFRLRRQLSNSPHMRDTPCSRRNFTVSRSRSNTTKRQGTWVTVRASGHNSLQLHGTSFNVVRSQDIEHTNTHHSLAHDSLVHNCLAATHTYAHHSLAHDSLVHNCPTTTSGYTHIRTPLTRTQLPDDNKRLHTHTHTTHSHTTHSYTTA
jgi:hypothetical protein